MRVSRRLVLGIGPWMAMGGSALAAHLDPAGSSVDAGWFGGIDITLALDEPVPWRTRVLADPPRLIVDLRDTVIEQPPFAPTRRIPQVEAGTIRPGWSRLVLGLKDPALVRTAAMQTQGRVAIRITMESASEAEFRVEADRPEPEEWALPATQPPAKVEGQGPLLVMLDPGHGGIDPGAQHGHLQEKRIVLDFAQNDLRPVLLSDGRFRVALTREDDRFVPLEARVTLARQAGADLFLSLHADALAEGTATGATIYSLSEEATDRAARILAEWHDRSDIIAGVDLHGSDDGIAHVLMSMARAETAPRTARLSKALEAGIRGQGITMLRHPRQKADFAVLKAPEIPSVLLELGFLSSAEDRAKLVDPAWRARMAQAVRDGLVAWAEQDAVIRPGLRR